MINTICHLDNVDLKLGEKAFGPFSLKISPGERIAILGPSGAGKTTLLKLLSHDLRSYSGMYKLKDSAIQTWPLHDLSRTRAVLPQSSDVAFGLLAQLVIELGRISVIGDTNLHEITRHAARLSYCEHLLTRGFDTLSGGEKARVQLARVFAQLWDERNGLILVDEPLASLDPGLQIELLESMRQYACDRNHSVVAILHDINWAMHNFDRLIFVKEGKIVGDLDPGSEAILALEHLYDIQLEVFSSKSGTEYVFPITRRVKDSI
jgi:iron complex transport system ATP-binding protein